MYIQMLFLAPPHKRYILPVSVNLPLLTTLGSYRFPTHAYSTTQPLFPLCYQMYLPHTPAIAPHAELSLSPLSLSPSRAKYMHCLSSPQPLMHAHARLGHSLETVSLFLPHGGPHSLNLALFIWVSFNLVFFHTQMIYLPVRASIYTLYTLSRRLSI